MKMSRVLLRRTRNTLQLQFEGPWVSIYVTTGEPCVADHPMESFRRQLIMIEKRETNDILMFADVHSKLIEQDTII
jgi:hypothetical protein